MASTLRIRVLGPVTVTRDGAPVVLPASRKVRALLAFLAIGRSGAVARARLCDLLWDVPNDPKGELRWCLSKLRAILDDDDRTRVVTRGEGVALDLADVWMDVLEVERLAFAGVERATTNELTAACDLFAGDLLSGLEIDGNPEFAGWLTAQRHRLRTLHLTLLAEAVRRSPRASAETFRLLESWLALAPFDVDGHGALLQALFDCGRIRDGEEHLAAAIRSFEREGLDWTPLRERWRETRSAPAESRGSATERSAAPIVTSAIPSAAAPVEEPSRRRASVAVMPFLDRTEGSADRSPLADGLTDDVITRLAKLRVLFVIARGTVYVLGERGMDAQEAGRTLGVEYVASGWVRRHADRFSVRIELVDTKSARIVWTDDVVGAREGGTFAALDSIVDRIVASIAEEIETAECGRAILKPPSSLDAWEAYHRGLWHMYKFTGLDNQTAAEFFRSALKLDPTFSRAYAGLSFTHFQNAFLDLTPDRRSQIDLAFEKAARSLDADDRDPGAHWAMGRALWLRGEQRESLGELERSIELSPNFALGHYTLGFVQSQSGDPRAAIEACNHSRQLSPFDPLQFAMLASRALAHVRLGELEEAAHWAVRATSRPNAHTHILAIAAHCLALANRRDEAKGFVARIRERRPGYGVEDLIRSFRFDDDTEKRLRRSARDIEFAGTR